MPEVCHLVARRIFLSLAVFCLLLVAGVSLRAQAITNLSQLVGAVAKEGRLHTNVDLNVTVCAASRPQVGVVIVKDSSGVELLQLDDFGRTLQPGERIRLQGYYCLLRKRDMGIQISVTPHVDNDGIHIHRTWSADVALKAGKIPLELDWFNGLKDYDLEVYIVNSNGVQRSIAPSNLWHAVVDDVSGRTNFVPGLRAECYEGYWEEMPDFALLKPVKTGVATSLDAGFRTRDERVALRFTGYFDAPISGDYRFRVRSDDGSLLFLSPPELPVIKLGFTNPPVPAPGYFGEVMDSLLERRWITVAGQVSFVSRDGKGMVLKLHSDFGAISVRVADAAGLDVSTLLNAQVKITGVGQGVLMGNQRIVLGRLYVAGANDIVLTGKTATGEPQLPINTIDQIRRLPIEDARRALPVHIRGVVTDAKNSMYDRWMSLQDSKRGIFVSLTLMTNTFPQFGQSWEVEGHSGAGDFAPVVIADKMTLLGNGHLPEPVRPSWIELVNGSMDVQWSELMGLVTSVQSNTVTLLLPEGSLEVRLDGYDQNQLKSYLKTVVRIRGVLYALWDAATREVRVGSVLMRNASICVDTPAPANPFDAVVKTPRELLLFDAQATTYRRVKVSGQIIHVDAGQFFLMADGAGLRIAPAGNSEVHPGDLVEAVGYPDISGASPLLREAILKKTGASVLPPGKRVSAVDLTQEALDSTRVRVEGKLLGWHLERNVPVLEMQSGAHLYLARLMPGQAQQLSLRVGSRLALEGVYVGRGHGGHPQSETKSESFELLLNSPADIAVLSLPPWWTLKRLLIVVGVLLLILAFTAVWITQLRRLVEQRTAQLQRETRERERIERQHALEAERSRIARDLHDDLGSSLTEISALASTGQRAPVAEDGRFNLFHAIASKARGLIAALDVIVWAVDPEDNSLQSLADYLSGYTEEFFSHTKLSCRFRVPVSFPPVTLEGRVRHDLLLAMKEALNNVVRHSEATEVEFKMAVSDQNLEIEVADNGKGFADGSGKDGHGLKNLPARLKNIGGECTVESRPGGGTTVKIRLPLPLSAGAESVAGGN